MTETPVLFNIRGPRGTSIRNPRRSGDNVLVDVVQTSAITGAETSQTVDLGNFRGMPGGTGYASRTASGMTTLTVEPGYTYDILVDGGATISLTGDGVQNGWMVALILSSTATIEGHPKPAGEYIAWKRPEGWVVRDVPQPEPTEVTPLAPIFDDVVGTYTIQNQPGLRWLVGGVERAPGTYSANAPRTLNFAASARNGFVVVGTRTFSHTFPTPAAVPIAPDSLTGLFGWWDPSDTDRTTVVSETVSQINDKSGKEHHLVQATAATRPPVGSINGRQAITLSSSASAPAQQIGLTFPSGSPAGSLWPASWTVTAVLRADAIVAGYGGGVSSPSIQHGGNGTVFGPSLNTLASTAFPKVQAMQTFVVTVVGSPTGVKLFVDGVQYATTATAAAKLSGLMLGIGAGGGSSSVGEVVMYDRANLTDDEIRNLYAGLKIRWAAR